MTAASILTVTGGRQQNSYAAKLINGGQVNVGSTGVVVSGQDAIFADGGAGQVRVTNAGTISGNFNALSLNDAGSLVTNSGRLIGSCVLNGGEDFFDGPTGVQTLIGGGDGNDTVFGGAGNERLFGNNNDDVLRGMGGDAGLDNLRGGGDDTLTGSTGADRIAAFMNDSEKLDLLAFYFASAAALASASSFGLRIDVPGEGMVFVAGLTLAQLSAGICCFKGET
jgi:Ca2+-binding RTX toxin-like protein